MDTLIVIVCSENKNLEIQMACEYRSMGVLLHYHYLGRNS